MPKQFYRNSTRKPLLFENTKMLIALEEKNRCAIYYNFRRTFVPNSRRHCRWRRRPHTVHAMWGAATAARTHASADITKPPWRYQAPTGQQTGRRN